jgi:RNA recognition motif-containing protein
MYVRRRNSSPITLHTNNHLTQVRNLEERIKVDNLKEALSEIFSEYGNILEIVAKTNLKAKGQAFIVFDNVESATRAIDEINGFELFDKPMVLDYAKTRSDATVLREGGEDELEVHKRRRLAEKGAFSLPPRKSAAWRQRAFLLRLLASSEC